MKKVLLIVALALLSIAAQAQSGTGYGIKAGISYNENGDLRATGEEIRDNGSSGRAGFHIGFWGKLNLPLIYIRPELFYTQTRSNYDLKGESLDYDIHRIDLPLLVGYKLIGPLHVFIGPAFQYIIDNDLDKVDIGGVENDFTVAFNAGLGVNLGPIGVDVRYERGFSENEAQFLTDATGQPINARVDSRPSQVILSASLRL